MNNTKRRLFDLVKNEDIVHKLGASRAFISRYHEETRNILLAVLNGTLIADDLDATGDQRKNGEHEFAKLEVTLRTLRDFEGNPLQNNLMRIIFRQIQLAAVSYAQLEPVDAIRILSMANEFSQNHTDLVTTTAGVLYEMLFVPPT